MFERFDAKARRTIFWARNAASLDRSQEISVLHLLAGIRKEMPELFSNLKMRESGLDVREASELSMEPVVPGEKGAPSKEIPLDQAAKDAMTSAAGLATKFASKDIEPVHLLLGILRGNAQLQKRLTRAGLSEADIHSFIARHLSSAIATHSDTVSSQRRIVCCGIGYDLHRLAEGRKLIIGGIEVPFDKGPVGHSDGDVLSHALCDALLGAAGLGDIGTHFPDTDPKWKGASSLLFLEHTGKLLDERRLRISHLDAVVILERPKLGPHFPAMREALAKSLGIAPEQINLKAKTNEGTGEIGRGEAIAAHTIATLEG